MLEKLTGIIEEAAHIPSANAPDLDAMLSAQARALNAKFCDLLEKSLSQGKSTFESGEIFNDAMRAQDQYYKTVRRLQRLRRKGPPSLQESPGWIAHNYDTSSKSES